MNIQSFLPLLFALSITGTMCSAASSHPSTVRLEKPDCIRAIGKAPGDMLTLEALLKENKLKEFYGKARELYFENNPKPEDMASISRFFWLNYYLASSPFFPFDDDDSTTKVSFNGNIDLSLTSESYSEFLKIARNNLDDFLREQSLNRKELAHLFSLYAARMLGKVRATHATNLSGWRKRAEEKKKKKDNEDQKILEDGEHTIQRARQFIDKVNARDRNLWSKETRNNNRKKTCLSIIERMEKDFVPTLVQLFPGKKGEVINYIRMAGYRDDEINSLIDRSVGRDPTTEFLYKGRSKKDAR